MNNPYIQEVDFSILTNPGVTKEMKKIFYDNLTPENKRKVRKIMKRTRK